MFSNTKLNITSEFNEVLRTEMKPSHSWRKPRARFPREQNLGEQGKTLGVLGEADPANR